VRFAKPSPIVEQTLIFQCIPAKLKEMKLLFRSSMLELCNAIDKRENKLTSEWRQHH
jgi:hypothetical protein